MQIKELQGQIYEALKGLGVRYGNYNQVNSLIQKVFIYPQYLNQSFKEYHNRVADQNHHNMDIRSLELFYNDMAINYTKFNNGFQSVLQLFFKTVPSSIEMGKFIKEGETSFNNLRFILILIFCPIIYDDNNKTSFIKMTNLILNLKQDQKECLSRWLTSMSGDKLEFIVQYTQRAIKTETIKLLPENMDKNDIKSVAHFIDIFCSFLGILYRSNQIWKRLFIDIFRNPDVMKYFSHQDQYKLYKSKINILNFIRYPFLFDIHYKLKLLEIENKDEQHTKMQQGMLHLLQAQALQNGPIQLNTAAINSLYLQVKVHRNNLLLDSMNQLMHAKRLKNPLKVTFIDEMGDDLGGVKKQFFQLLIKQLFDPNRFMFVTKNNNTLHWFNGMSFEDNIMYQFTGIVVGLSIYNGIMLDLKFPSLVYKKLLLKDEESLNQFDELQQIQPDTHKSFKYILDTKEPLEDLELYFTAQVMQFDQKVIVPLRPKGQYIKVSQANKVQYVNLYSKYMVNSQIETQFNAFKKGFFKVVTGSMIKLFSPQQLERIVCGLEVINILQLKKSAKYEGGYQQHSYMVRCLWEILNQFDLQKKKAFLFFSTGSDRSPIGGLSTMKFTIQRHGPDTENVPTSHTCSNILMLPEYSSKDKLRKKLLIALEHNQGFGLI